MSSCPRCKVGPRYDYVPAARRRMIWIQDGHQPDPPECIDCEILLMESTSERQGRGERPKDPKADATQPPDPRRQPRP
jgi:hypothetical protein